MKARWEIVLVVLLYATAVWLWSLPFQSNQMPYGEPDATSHFVVADATSQTDKPITTLPQYIDVRYGFDNQLQPHTLWYHPPYHLNFAELQIFANSRFLPIYFFNMILCTVMVLGTYFLIRKLYGILPAFLASFLLIFSGRDYMVYLWGQWPERISYAFIPIILYCYYVYVEKRRLSENATPYFAIMAVLLGVNFYIHPAGLFHSLAALGVYAVVVAIMERRVPFAWKDLGIGVGIFLLMAAIFPLQTGNVIVTLHQETADQKNVGNLARLFQWYPNPKDFYGAVPDSYFSYALMNGMWTLPFLLIGILVLLLRRKNQDYLLLSWLLSLYIMIHLDVIGSGRVHRSLAAEAHIFYPLIAIGFVWLISLIKVPKPAKTYIKIAGALLFITVTILVNGKMAYGVLSTAYAGVSRLTPVQYDAATWMLKNLPQDAPIDDIGTLTLSKKRFIQYISHHEIVKINFDDNNVTPDYLVIDYSDLAPYAGDPSAKQQLNQLAAVDAGIRNSSTLIYDKDYIRVFKLG